MPTLDELDIRLVRTLVGSDATSSQDSFRVPIHSIAKSLGVDENTVRNRIERWRKTGYLRGWRLATNPTLFGLEMFQAWLDVHPESRKTDALRVMANLPTVGGIKDYFGNSIWVSLFSHDEKEFKDQLKQISRICNSEKMTWVRSHFPRCKISLRETDWEIIGRMQSDPWKPFVSVARELGLSTRTVRRRMSRMTEANAVFMMADIDLRSVRGAHFADLLVLTQNDEVGRRACSAVAGRLKKMTIFEESGPGHSLFALQLDNISNVREVLRMVKSESGVTDARLDLLEDVVLLNDASQVRANEGRARRKNALLPPGRETKR